MTDGKLAPTPTHKTQVRPRVQLSGLGVTMITANHFYDASKIYTKFSGYHIKDTSYVSLYTHLRYRQYQPKVQVGV